MDVKYTNIYFKPIFFWKMDAISCKILEALKKENISPLRLSKTLRIFCYPIKRKCMKEINKTKEKLYFFKIC